MSAPQCSLPWHIPLVGAQRTGLGGAHDLECRQRESAQAVRACVLKPPTIYKAILDEFVIFAGWYGQDESVFSMVLDWRQLRTGQRLVWASCLTPRITL
jgi:hypothetical protein